jgi:hypothetical protein
MPPPVARRLSFAVAGYGIGILFAIVLPIFGVAGAPLTRAVAANLPVFAIDGQFPAPVLTPTPLLARWLITNQLPGLIL